MVFSCLHTFLTGAVLKQSACVSIMLNSLIVHTGSLALLGGYLSFLSVFFVLVCYCCYEAGKVSLCCSVCGLVWAAICTCTNQFGVTLTVWSVPYFLFWPLNFSFRDFVLFLFSVFL